MLDQKNLVLAIALSVAIILGFQYFYETPKTNKLAEQQAAEQAMAPSAEPGDVPLAQGDVPVPSGVQGTSAAALADTRAAALDPTPRIELNTPRLRGSISRVGGRIDDLTLIDYRETIDPDSPQITLLSPRGAPNAYFAEFGWVADDQSTPGRDEVWSADNPELTPDQPVTFSWTNEAGLRLERTIAIDENYMLTVTQRVVNNTQSAVTLSAYGLISRTGTPETLGFYILHEGLLGVFNETLQEEDYDDLVDAGTINVESTGGWIGITDKYWLVALVPDQSIPFKGRFSHAIRNGDDRYQTDFLRDPVTVQPGTSFEVTDRLFAGAKEVDSIDEYDEALGITRFDLAIDWGWLYFLTKPIFKAIEYFNDWLGNFGLAILLLTVLVKLAFFPLANKSYTSMSKMKKLQPKMMELREEFKDDKQALQKQMMELYKLEKINPMSGCLPVVIQIPVFFALYKVLFVTIEMRHTPFYGWITDLSAPDPTSLFNLFGLLPFDPPAFLAIGVWPLVMGATMLLQFRLNPKPTDPTQAKIMMMMPIMFTFLFARFPAGLVIYWTWNNVLSIAQQWVIMRRMGVPT